MILNINFQGWQDVFRWKTTATLFFLPISSPPLVIPDKHSDRISPELIHGKLISLIHFRTKINKKRTYIARESKDSNYFASCRRWEMTSFNRRYIDRDSSQRHTSTYSIFSINNTFLLCIFVWEISTICTSAHRVGILTRDLRYSGKFWLFIPNQEILEKRSKKKRRYNKDSQ